MAEFKQQHCLLAIDTPLGDDALLLPRLADEEIFSAHKHLPLQQAANDTMKQNMDTARCKEAG
ncbi:MAG: hypothetical protein MI754_07325 [Chromatiales bacterium]|nr:hypothetical protein [Chromatiales bacterium]